MNDYLLRSMGRQRHEQILAEVRAARRAGLSGPRAAGTMRNIIRAIESFLKLSKSPVVCNRPALGERKSR